MSARSPCVHRFFAPVAGRYQDPLLIAETMRQTTILLAHAEFDVPVGDQFVMWELGYISSHGRLALDAHPEHPEHPGGPWDITVDVSCSRIRRRARASAPWTWNCSCTAAAARRSSWSTVPIPREIFPADLSAASKPRVR
ncbi:AfsA-related hotdog domain-containing protein [Streptomyces sp. NPDC002917]|uniref:AfsA-related hotdog domain-containing protein n=1 Tax=Streptomyces sp. NPDC002917 TaxID=3364671 RepID=UPI003688449C